MLFLLILTVIVLVVPIRYQVKGQLAEKQPEVRGRITWFLHLVYIKFLYEKKFRMQLRVCGIVVYDNHSERTTDTKRRKGSKIVSKENEEYELQSKKIQNEVLLRIMR